MPQHEATSKSTVMPTVTSQNGGTHSGTSAAGAGLRILSERPAGCLGTGGEGGAGTVASLPHVGHATRAPALATSAAIGIPHAGQGNSKPEIVHLSSERVAPTLDRASDPAPSVRTAAWRV
jgi:hypothetical protein